MSLKLAVAKAVVRFDAEHSGGYAPEAARRNAQSAATQAASSLPAVGMLGQASGLAVFDEFRGTTPGGVVKTTVGFAGPLVASFTGPIGAGVNAAVNLGWAAVDAVQAAAWNVIAQSER